MNQHGAILVRHGEVENPDHLVYADLPGFGLSGRGRRQAEETAARLADFDVAAVYSSPLQRAVETAVQVARPHGLAVITDRRLIEWRLADRWAGHPWERLSELFPGELEAYLAHPWDLPFSSESLDELAGRMAGAVERMVGRHPDRMAVVVSHQDPIQAARLALTGRSLHGLNDDKPGHAEAFVLTAASPWSETWRWAPDDQDEFPPSS